ncbi:hypothetical protein ACTMTJ_34060 [Phytohabitans sp. LJ34]
MRPELVLVLRYRRRKQQDHASRLASAARQYPRPGRGRTLPIVER